MTYDTTKNTELYCINAAYLTQIVPSHTTNNNVSLHILHLVKRQKYFHSYVVKRNKIALYGSDERVSCLPRCDCT